MKLKNTWMKFLALLLILALLLPCAVAEDSVQADEPYLLEVFMKYDTIPQLFKAAEKALQEKADPAKVRDALYTAADMKDMYPYFSYAIEDYVAMGGKAYNRLIDVLTGDENHYRNLSAEWRTDRSRNYSIGFDAYNPDQASSKFKSMYGDKSAECNVSSYFLIEADFKTLYKKDFSKFVPSHPRPGYVCIVVKDEAQSWPKKAWKDYYDNDDDIYFRENLQTLFNAIYASLDDDGTGTPPPVITGNPNLASSFLIYNATYAPDNQKYTIDKSIRVSGYKNTISLSLKDASTKKELAKYSETISIDLDDDDLYFRWNNGIIVRTNLPDFKSKQPFRAFTKSLASEIRKQDNLSSASRPLTESNAKAVLNGILQAQAAGAAAWETAIYESGAEDITFSGSKSVSFSLRNFNPNLKKLGAYADAKDPDAWLDSALQRIAKHNLTVTLNLSNGVPTKKSLNELKAAVQKAANSAKKAWASADITAALKDRFFPSPVKKNVSSYTQLFKQTDRFRKLYKKYLANHDFISRNLFSVICYAQRSLTVNTNQGPHKLSLTFTGIPKPEKYVKSAANQVVNSMAYKPLNSRKLDEDPEDTLMRRVSKNAVSSHTGAKDTFTLTVDLDQMSPDTMPPDYTSYLSGFDLRKAAENMNARISSLPDIAAVEMPGTKLLSGGKSGRAQMVLSLSAESSPTYIQLRKKDTKEKVATFFIHPGKKITLKAPGGDYYIVYCSGTFWYGEKKRFMEPDKIFYSEPLHLKNSYSQSYELNVSNGNIGTHPGSPSDLDD